MRYFLSLNPYSFSSFADSNVTNSSVMVILLSFVAYYILHNVIYKHGQTSLT